MPISLIKEEEEHILRVLPILLKRDTQFRDSLYSIFSETFIKRDDFSELKEIVKELGIKVNELGNFQRETQKQVQELGIRVNELAEAQKRTEEKIGNLATKVDNLATAVGSLSDTIGFGLEDVAKLIIPGYLLRHMGIKIKDELERRFFQINGREAEINLYGEGATKEGEKIRVFGECKSKIKEAEVKKFLDKLEILRDIKGKMIKVMFGFYIHPSANIPAMENDIILIASYQR